MFYSLIMFLFLPVSDCDAAYERWPESLNVVALTACVTNASPGDCVVADAGNNFSAAPGPAIALNASATSVPHQNSALQYTWTQVDNGSAAVVLSGADTATPTFAATEQGEYVFQLTAAWYCREDSDTVTVTVGARAFPAALNGERLVTTPCQPVQLTYSNPGDDRLFIVTKPGVIQIYKDGGLLATPFLDIQSLVSGNCAGSSEQGLLGMAFDPNYSSNGIFYVNYTGTFPSAGGSSRDTRIVAYGTQAGNPDLADTGTAALLMTIAQPETNHNGGQIHFGPDNFLYIGMGDGGGGGDNHGSIGNGQDPQALLGKMLRVQTQGFNPLGIPADNPFVGDPSTADEIWALGMRNPWRFSFDRGTGDLYIGDVGQGNWEEVDWQAAGAGGGQNYGWRLKEGDHCFNPSSNCDPGGLTDPIYEYNSNAGYCSVIGGYVYRGGAIPDLDGFYIFTDWCVSGSSTLPNYATLIQLDGNWIHNDLEIYVNDQIVHDSVVAFGEDSRGELYTLHTDGDIRKITGIRAFHTRSGGRP